MGTRTSNTEGSNFTTFMSYNSTGMSSAKCQWINEICLSYNVDFLNVQEHFKSTKNTDRYFKEQFKDYFSYVVPAHRSPGQDSGRAKAGLAQLSRQSLNIKKDRVTTHSFRLQAQILNISFARILWINSYLPTDPQTTGAYDPSDLLELLREVEYIIESEKYTDVIWAGDLNWDTSRSSQFSVILKNFVEKIGLQTLWAHHDIDFTHLHTDSKSTSTIDHFLLSPGLLQLISEAGVIHRGDNMSRHSPIWIKLNLGSLPVRNKVLLKSAIRPSWNKATEDDISNYGSVLNDKLALLKAPSGIDCCNPLCNNQAHSEERDSFVLDILMSIVESSHLTLPLKGGRGPGKTKIGLKTIPGWTEEVEPFRKDSLYWHKAWLSEGRPNHGWLHKIMVQKRLQYHYMVRKLKRKADLIRAGKLFAASFESDINLLKEMKRIKGGGFYSNELPDSVAGANGEEEVVEKFKEVYSSLYNSAETNVEMANLAKKVTSLIKNDSLNEVKKVTGAKVKEAVTLMKPFKSDVSKGFTSDALINGPQLLFDLLASVFRSWIYHGTVTKSLLVCAFLPLLKNALKDPADPGSYRAIAGSSLILKLFEKVILVIWGSLLESDSLQFGFKANTSTTQCSWLVQEVIGYYLKNGSHPIITVLDCSKAFDTCKFSILFGRLLEKGVPAVVVRTFMYIYEQQYAWVMWGKSVSSVFEISNGTRQGSIASPSLWTIYLDPLIKELRQLGVGCHVAGLFMGVVVYADDVLLMAPNRAAMQLMLDKCESYAARNNIMYSTDPDPNKSKSKCIYICGGKKNLPKPVPLTLCGQELPWVSSATHLGHELHESGSMEYDAEIKKSIFINQSVEIRETFYFASPNEVISALKVYCSSFYGCMQWNLGGAKALQVFNAWNTAVRLIWRVPRATRTFLLQNVLVPGLTSARSDILSRYAGFARGLKTSASQEVCVMFNLVRRDIRSTTGNNLAIVEAASGLDPFSYGSRRLKEEISKKEIVPIPGMDRWRLPYLTNLLEQRQMLSYFGRTDEANEISKLIDSLCVN